MEYGSPKRSVDRSLPTTAIYCHYLPVTSVAPEVSGGNGGQI